LPLDLIKLKIALEAYYIPRVEFLIIGFRTLRVRLGFIELVLWVFNSLAMASLYNRLNSALSSYFPKQLAVSLSLWNSSYIL
jgi:hypothetical protein